MPDMPGGHELVLSVEGGLERIQHKTRGFVKRVFCVSPDNGPG